MEHDHPPNQPQNGRARLVQAGRTSTAGLVREPTIKCKSHRTNDIHPQIWQEDLSSMATIIFFPASRSLCRGTKETPGLCLTASLLLWSSICWRFLIICAKQEISGDVSTESEVV